MRKRAISLSLPSWWYAGFDVDSCAGIRIQLIRELIADLEKHGKGSHRNFTHPRLARPVTISGNAGDDAKQYQEKAAKAAIAEATR